MQQHQKIMARIKDIIQDHRLTSKDSFRGSRHLIVRRFIAMDKTRADYHYKWWWLPKQNKWRELVSALKRGRVKKQQKRLWHNFIEMLKVYFWWIIFKLIKLSILHFSTNILRSIGWKKFSAFIKFGPIWLLAVIAAIDDYFADFPENHYTDEWSHKNIGINVLSF